MRISGINSFYNMPKNVGFKGELRLIDRSNNNGNTTETSIYYPCKDEPDYYISEMLTSYNRDIPKQIADLDGTKTTYYEYRTTLGPTLPFTKTEWDSFSQQNKDNFIDSLNED